MIGYEDRACRTIIADEITTTRLILAAKRSGIWRGSNSAPKGLSKVYVTSTGRELAECLSEEFGQLPHYGYYVVDHMDAPYESVGQMASGW